MTGDTAILLRKAVGLHRRGNLPAAEALCRQVLHADPHNPDALHFLGLIALRNGSPKGAVRLIDEATAAAAQHASPRRGNGQVPCRRGQRHTGTPRTATVG